MKTINVMLDYGAKMPTRAHELDAGLDIYAMGDWIIWPHSFKVISTGVHAEIAPGYVGKLESKSSLMLKGLTCRGTIDCGYTGEIKAVVFNHSDMPYTVRDGDKVTQLVIYPIATPTPIQVRELGETERGDGGFGSTGR